MAIARQTSGGLQLPASLRAVRSLRQRLHKSRPGIDPVAAAELARLRKGPQDLAWRSPAKPPAAFRPPRPCGPFAACGSGYTNPDPASTL
ncbi:hypothetical protein DWF74_22855 [Pseudomonas protegens]|nr:hypothetical protein DWF74_22855 [Pseudomonas protegens]